jgi:hypothetical protein
MLLGTHATPLPPSSERMCSRLARRIALAPLMKAALSQAHRKIKSLLLPGSMIVVFLICKLQI